MRRMLLTAGRLPAFVPGSGFTFTALVLLFLLAQYPLRAQSINKSRLGKGVQFLAADTSFSLKLSARFQTLYLGEYALEEEDYADQLLIRRARLKLEGFIYVPTLEYKFQLGLSNRDIGGPEPEFNNAPNVVLDAYLLWQFAPNFSLLLGQAILPGNRERVISSQKLQFVDRSLLNAAYNIDRDVGVQLFHAFSLGQVVFKEAVAISTGEGRNLTVSNRGGYHYTARAEVLPFGEFTGDGDYFGADLVREPKPKLSVGATYSYNDRASREGGTLGDFYDLERTLQAVFLDAIFKYRGITFLTEYAVKEAASTPVVEVDELGVVVQSFQAGTGFNVQAGYLFPNNVEVAGRYSTVHPNALTQQNELAQYTLGVSKYIVGHTLKVQSDVSLLQEAEESTELMYRFQVEIGF